MALSLHRRTVTVNGLPLFYREAGSGPTLLCLHGMYGRGEDWVPFMERYADRYRILAPDQRGHGLSGRPVARYDGEQMADDALGLLKAVGAGPALVVGHSMGGRNAAYLAARNPGAVTALALLDIGTGGSPTPSQVDPGHLDRADGFTAAWPPTFPSLEAVLRQLRGQVSGEGAVRYFLQSLVETPAGYDFLFSRWAMAAIGEYWQDWSDLLPALTCPVLLLRADKSWCLAPEVAAAMVPRIADCTYREITGSDHNLHTDNPEEFYAAFDEFLARIPRFP